MQATQVLQLSSISPDDSDPEEKDHVMGSGPYDDDGPDGPKPPPPPPPPPDDKHPQRINRSILND